MIARATAELRAADPVLGVLIDSLSAPLARLARLRPPGPGEHYAGLVRTIVGQQLSTRAAARDLDARCSTHFGGRPPDAAGGARRPTPRSCALPPASRARR